MIGPVVSCGCESVSRSGAGDGAPPVVDGGVRSDASRTCGDGDGACSAGVRACGAGFTAETRGGCAAVLPPARAVLLDCDPTSAVDDGRDDREDPCSPAPACEAGTRPELGQSTCVPVGPSAPASTPGRRDAWGSALALPTPATGCDPEDLRDDVAPGQPDPCGTAPVCPAGTSARLGSASCVGVGPARPLVGSEPDSWGHALVLPPSRAATTGCRAGVEAGCLDAPDCEFVDHILPVLGEAACQPLGPCLTTFPAAPAGPVVYVDARAPAGGDGTRAAPKRTLAEAVAAAPDGATLLLAPGYYAPGPAIARSLSIVGACPYSVALAPEPLVVSGGDLVVSSLTLPAGLDVSGGRVRAEALFVRGPVRVHGSAASLGLNRSIVGATGHGVEVSDGAMATLSQSALLSSSGDQLRASGRGTVVRGDRMVISSSIKAVRPLEGTGVLALAGADVALVDSALVGVGTGASASGYGTHLALERTVLAGGGGQVGALFGSSAGLAVADRAMVTASNVAIVRARGTGIYAGDEGTTLTLEDVEVSDGRPVQQVQSTTRQSWYVTGDGLQVAAGASARLTRVSFLANRQVGVSVRGAGTALDGTGVLVAGTRPEPPLQGAPLPIAPGLEVSQGARATLRESAFLGNREMGAEVDGAGSLLVLENSTIARTRTYPRPAAGALTFPVTSGLSVTGGATAMLRGTSLVGNRRSSVFARDADTTVSLEGCSIDDTRSFRADQGGWGVQAFQGARVTLDRSWVTGSRDLAMLAESAGTVVDIRSSVLSGTRPRPGDGARGRAVGLWDGAVARLRDTAVLGHRDTALYANGPGTLLDITGGVVAGTRPGPGSASGRGIMVWQGATAELRGVTVADHLTAGAQVGPFGGALRISDSAVLRTEVERSDGLFGYGIVASTGGNLELVHSLVGEHSVGVVFSEATGIVTASRVRGNHIGVAIPEETIGSQRPPVVEGLLFSENLVDRQSVSLPVPVPENEARPGARMAPGGARRASAR